MSQHPVMEESSRPAAAAGPSPGGARPSLLAEYLAEREEPCPRCGYNLRGLTRHWCPECGEALRLSVALVEPKLGAWLTALVAAALGAGGALLFVSLALVAAPSGWWAEPSARLLLVLLATGTISGVLLLVGRRAYQRRPVWLQRLVALGVCGMVALLGGAIITVF